MSWRDRRYEPESYDTSARARPAEELQPLAATPLADLAPDNWVELQYAYADGVGVPGASYVVSERGGGELARGRLDSVGFARVPLPLDIDEVEYRFENDPTSEYVADLVPPKQKPPEPGWLDRIGDGARWVWGAIQGDFERDPTVGQIVLNTALTMIPVVDQVGDIRDTAANLKLLLWDQTDRSEAAVGLVLTALGWIPVVGSLGKGIVKLARHMPPGSKKALERLIELYNHFKKGNAVKHLRQFRDALGDHLQAAQSKVDEILDGLANAFRKVASAAPILADRCHAFIARIADARTAVADATARLKTETAQALDRALAETHISAGFGPVKAVRRLLQKAGLVRGSSSRAASKSLRDDVVILSHANDTATPNIRRVKPIEGFTDVELHGTPTRVDLGGGRMPDGSYIHGESIDGRQLAERIRNDPGYDGGAVRLLSCSTGKRVPGADCVAQQVADELGTTVSAPNDILWVYANGKTVVAPYKGQKAAHGFDIKNARPDLDNPGGWDGFIPQQTYPRN